MFNIYRDHNELSLGNHATLAALARTCRKFKEPALDSLWKEIFGFKPLISCLPEGVSNINAQGQLVRKTLTVSNTQSTICQWTLQRPLSYSEWRLMDRYARRICSFTVSTADIDILDDQVVQVLISAPSATPLLSNLRSLVWYDGRQHFFPLLRTLFGPTITSMKLGFGSTQFSFASSALMASLGARCPSIQELECVCRGENEESSDIIVEALCGLQKLLRLETGVLYAEDLVRLASLPSLKSLHFDLGTYDEPQLISIPTNFSQLNEVRITAPSHSDLNHCLKNVRCLSCRSLKIFVDSDYLDYDPEVSLLLNGLLGIANDISLLKCFSPVLEELVFQLECNFSDFDDEDILANPVYALSFDAVVPLLSFSRLTDLRLDWICTSAIDDASLKTMAQSWPQLETFWFGGAVPWVVPPSLTSIEFAHLIYYCRRLCNIQMSFCACPVDINSESFSIPNENITTVSVGVSPILDPILVTCQLRRLLPKLAEVYFSNCLSDELFVPPSFGHYVGGWSRVNEFLGVRRYQRRHER